MLAFAGFADALDITEFFSPQSRPDFPKKANDWPPSGKSAQTLLQKSLARRGTPKG